jgi:polyisoprenoid-binding protein YceI
MALHPGRTELGPAHGRILLRTFREGLAASVGHDLIIEATRWSGELEVGEDLAPVSLAVRIDMTALAVREGSGGLKPLTDSDRREIGATARKVLAVSRHPEASFAGTSFQPGGADGSGVIGGDLTLAGATRPVRLQVAGTGGNGYRATVSSVQSSFGITPYRGFLGALKVRDAVDVEIEADLPGGGQAGP